MQGTIFTPNTAAYETLKARGLPTVTNDSLRLAIARHYDWGFMLPQYRAAVGQTNALRAQLATEITRLR